MVALFSAFEDATNINLPPPYYHCLAVFASLPLRLFSPSFSSHSIWFFQLTSTLKNLQHGPWCRKMSPSPRIPISRVQPNRSQLSVAICDAITSIFLLRRMDEIPHKIQTISVSHSLLKTILFIWSKTISIVGLEETSTFQQLRMRPHRSSDMCIPTPDVKLGDRPWKIWRFSASSQLLFATIRCTV